MLEFTRRRKRLYIIFEFVDGNVLDYLESQPNKRIDPVRAKDITWQLLRALEFMHQVNRENVPRKQNSSALTL